MGFPYTFPITFGSETNDFFLKNGLLKLHIADGILYGLNLYGYISGAWASLMNRIYFTLQTSSIDVSYPFLKSIMSYSPDKIIVKVRLEDTATQDGDYYADVTITLERSKYYILVEFDEVYPQQDILASYTNSTLLRFGYVGDAESSGIGDDDLNIDGTNTTRGDNFLVSFDNLGTAAIAVFAVNEKPDTDFFSDDGGLLQLRDIASADLDAVQLLFGIVPFSLIVNTFIEAEDATITGGSVEDPCAGASGTCVKLDTQNDQCNYDFTAGTHLPAGRYIALIRAQDTNQIADDLSIRVWNQTDSVFRNEENAVVTKTVTGAWAYYQVVFDITDQDVTDTDSIFIGSLKTNADANDLFVDYFLIVPIGDGQNFPQDIAHSALRGRKVYKRVLKR